MPLLMYSNKITLELFNLTFSLPSPITEWVINIVYIGQVQVVYNL
jgi:hypothetical protein